MPICKNPKTVMLENNIKVNERGVDISQINIAPDPDKRFKHGGRYKVYTKNKNTECWIPMDPVTLTPDIKRIKDSNNAISNNIIRYVCGLAVYACEEITEFLANPNSENSIKLKRRGDEYVNLKSKEKNIYIELGYASALSRYNKK